MTDVTHNDTLPDLDGLVIADTLWSTDLWHPTEPSTPPAVEPRKRPESAPGARPGPAVEHPGRALAGDFHRNMAAAHTSALQLQRRLQLLALGAASGVGPAPLDGARAPAPAASDLLDNRPQLDDRPLLDDGPQWAPRLTAFVPLARSTRSTLDAPALEALTRGDVSEVFGPAYAQPGCNGDVRLAAAAPLLLTAVHGLNARGGSHGLGGLRAPYRRPGGSKASQALRTAAVQAAEVMALYLGLPLCFADCELVVGLPPGTGVEPVREHVTVLDPDMLGEIRLDVVVADLLPRPWFAVQVVVEHSGRRVAQLDGLTLWVRPHPSLLLGPVRGGTVPQFLGRFNAAGERALLSEFSVANISHGDQSIAMGPEFARFNDRPAIRLPSGELLLVGRVMSIDGQRGPGTAGGSWVTEYDSPADAWYYQDTANASMPNCVYMETTLQSAALLGPYLGGTLDAPEDEILRLRNLQGSATALREIDLRDTTVRQTSTVLSTSRTPGAFLQNFGYTAEVDGVPIYRGESLFGYFNTEALANQTGLDLGREVPTWLEQHGRGAAVRTIDVAQRRADGGRWVSTGRLALLDRLDVVDGGGSAGLGYLHAVQPVDPTDWYFSQHFHLDPVVPGSLGVETVIQAVQEWMVDTGLVGELDEPAFVLPVGAPLEWRYRGQFLPSDSPMTLEVHITGTDRRPGRVRVTAAASVWKPGLRIYQVNPVTVELREPGAPEWSTSGA